MIDGAIRKLLGLSPALLPPINENDGRLPVHSAQQQHFKELMLEAALKRIEHQERRLDKLEKALQRKRMRTIHGGRRI
jgi:hypothetical protein